MDLPRVAGYYVGMYAILAIIWILGFGWLGAWAAGQKNRSLKEGLLLALVLGPYGVLVELLLPTKD